MALGGSSWTDLGLLKATIPSLCEEPRSQQVWIECEIKVQTVVGVPKLVEDSIQVHRSL